jgi:sulfite reductase (NADPH) flavoprotein alpha-component
MIGPETGIAAFRSFLYEREVSGANGNNWLFFGEKNFTTDFLYQAEIKSWVETGLLTKVNVAFLEGLPEQLYIHDKMYQQGAEFFQWLQSGAYLYVCGIKDPMSIEVEKMLLKIIEEFGNKTPGESQQCLEQLKKEGRYSKDVY